MQKDSTLSSPTSRAEAGHRSHAACTSPRNAEIYGQTRPTIALQSTRQIVTGKENTVRLTYRALGGRCAVPCFLLRWDCRWSSAPLDFHARCG